eukprot:1864787-Prymnesium_polylepis.1
MALSLSAAAVCCSAEGNGAPTSRGSRRSRRKPHSTLELAWHSVRRPQQWAAALRATVRGPLEGGGRSRRAHWTHEREWRSGWRPPQWAAALSARTRRLLAWQDCGELGDRLPRSLSEGSRPVET